MTDTPKILVLHGGGRPGGNTETLTKFAVAGLPVTEYYLRDYNIKEIVDQRHEDGGFTPVDDDFDKIFADALTHDIWIFSTPLHWYSMAVPLKRFVDRICRFVNMQYGGYIIGDANRPATIVHDRKAMALAAELRAHLRDALGMME